MRVEVRLFATLRETVGQHSVARDVPAGAQVGDVLRDLVEEYPALELFEADGTLQGYLNVMIDGRNIIHLDGLDTELSEGDQISVFPPAEGGGHHRCTPLAER